MLLILAQPRTGSSTLFRACMMHPDIEGVFEPFRKPGNRICAPDPGGILRSKYNKRSSRPTKFLSLTKQLQFANCVKTIDGHLNQNLNKLWAKQPGIQTVILLRENLLKQSLSLLMTQQSKVWHWFESDGVNIKNNYSRDEADEGIMKYYKDGKSGTLVHKNYQFNAIPISDVQNWMNQLAARKQNMKNIPGLHLSYEDIYEKAITFEDRFAVVSQVLEHGGFDVSKFKPTKSLRVLFEISRFNSEETYKKIPNIDEIEKKLGSPENGYLFK